MRKSIEVRGSIYAALATCVFTISSISTFASRRGWVYILKMI